MLRILVLMLALVGTLSTICAASFLKTQTTAAVNGTSSLVLAANTYRNYLLLVNRGATTIYVKFNAAHTGTEGVPIPSGGNYEPPNPPAEAVYAVTAGAAESLFVTEGTAR